MRVTPSANPEPAGLPEAELAAWLRLLATPGLGRDGARRLLALAGSPEAALRLQPEDLAGRMTAAAAQTLVRSLAEVPEGHAERLSRTLAWRDAAPRRRVMVLGEPDYPAALLHTADPPLLLYLEGDAARLSHRSVAIVGSRHATPQGRDNARSFARALAGQGWVVVSGLAAGIDAAAHEGALAAGPAPGAGTIAVVGTGLDQVYPRSNRVLAERIVADGLLVSELPLGAPPLAAHFPQRNRIIAGLARGTLVVEAAIASGSLITARLALEAGREVMAVPGSIHAAGSRGCHLLIRQGAALVTSADEVLQELEGLPAAAGEAVATAGLPVDAGAAADDADPVLRALGHDPVGLDQLMGRCGWTAPRLSAHLLTLELDGRVARLPGGLFQRLDHG